MLYDHQQTAILTAPAKHGLFFDVGTGKSLTALKLCERRASSALIIATKSLKKNWQNEVEKWISPGVDILWKIMSKEEFRRDHEAVPYFEAVIVDEAHFFGNPQSQLHKALMAYIKKYNPKYIWALTATPILASVTSAWALAKILGYPVNYMSFRRQFFYEVQMGHKTIPVQRTGIEKEIAQFLRNIGTVVAKEDCLDLPPVTHKFEYFALTAQQRKAIKDLDKDPTTVNRMTMNTKLLQIASGTLKLDGKNYRSIKSDKVARLKELAEQYPKMVIVCKHKAELRMLHEELPSSFVYDGDTPEYERNDMVTWSNNNALALLLLQADMGIGFNLEKVDLMVFYSHTYDYVKYAQCLGRIHRIGQTKPVTYIHMITEDTIDEAVWACLERKESFDMELYNRKR